MTVKQRQALLAYLGYYTGPLDGDWGKGSRAGCQAFQRDYGLTADGLGGPVTDKALVGAVAGTMVPVQQPQSGQETAEVPAWWKDIRYFKRSEFKCKCGGRYCNGFPAEPSEKLIRIADELRGAAGVSITVSSGVRCQTHNDSIPGSVKNSRHLSGKAMDFCIKGWSSSKTLAAVKKRSGIRYAYAIDGSFVHMDVE